MNETDKNWFFGLEPDDDQEGAIVLFGIELEVEECFKSPREHLRFLMDVAQYVLDHDLLEVEDGE